jgi:DNA sulfur modification protein DndE
MRVMDSNQIDTVRLDADTKIRLSTLKRRTGIENWNTLCRWAFCLSLSDATRLRDLQEREIGAIEMSWKTFAGEDEELYRLLLIRRAESDLGRTDRDALAKTVRQHISRGTARLAANRHMKSTKDLVELALLEDCNAAVLSG